MKVKKETATFFETQADFRTWLEKNHTEKTELIVGFYKVKTNKPSITWSQSVDQALCFGWIDGVRKSIDEESYCIRFTPRRTTSIWSSINIKKIEELTKTGQITPAGLEAFRHKRDSHAQIYAYEKKVEILDKKYEQQFKNNRMAWDFFINQAPSYRKVMIHWIGTAKQDKTKQSRLEKLIEACENKHRLK